MSRILYWVFVCWTISGVLMTEGTVTETCRADIIRGKKAMEPVVTKTIILNEGDSESARQNIKQYYIDTQNLFSDMYDMVKRENLWTRADPLRHPVGWYLMHTAVFMINKLRLARVLDKPIKPAFESRFAVGVDEMSWDDKLEDRDDWPEWEEMEEYLVKFNQTILNVVDTIDISVPISWNSKAWTLLMGIEHMRIHVETSSVLFRQLPLDAITPHGVWENLCTEGIFSSEPFTPNLGASGHAPKNELLPVEGKTVQYGREIDETPTYAPQAPVYGWDNEYGDMTVDVPSFNASKYLVSNEEYYEFVLDGGYKDSKYWTEEGWKWVTTTGSKHPKFWIEQPNGGFKYRQLATVTDLPWDWPVITNNLEAQAFCSWKAHKTGQDIRLPTEDEWFAMRTTGKYASIDQPNWDKAPGNINLEYFTSETPVDMFEFGGTGFYDVVGNVWQHTLTPQHPFDGFTVHTLYDDFTTPCFGPHHNMLKGGSWISTGNEATMGARYQFRRHFFQFAGIRYVSSPSRDIEFIEKLKDVQDESAYNQESVVIMYTHFHYWDEPLFGVENFAKAIAQVSIKHSNPEMRNKVLDLGCAVGRSTFEFATAFKQAVGIDFSARFIGVGYRLQEYGFLEWKMTNHGLITDPYRVTLEDLGYDEDVSSRTFFYQGDAQNLDPSLTGFDLVLGANLIDRLPNPRLFLEHIHERINMGGKLILMSPYTWLTEYTNQNNWVGGYYDPETHKPVTTPDMLKKILSPHFKYETEENVPFVIRETARKHQHSISHCTVWTRIK